MKITDETRRWPSSGPGKSSQTLSRPATARTMSPLAWVTLRLCILPISRTAQVAHQVLVNKAQQQHDTMVRGSIVVSISARHAEDRAQFPAAEITAAHGGEQDDDDSSSRKRRTVMSSVA